MAHNNTIADKIEALHQEVLALEEKLNQAQSSLLKPKSDAHATVLEQQIKNLETQITKKSR